MQTKRCQKFPALRKSFSRPRSYTVDRKWWRSMDREKYFSETYYLHGNMTPAKKKTTTGPIEQEPV